MTNLKLNDRLQVVDMDSKGSQKRVVGRLVGNGGKVSFIAEKQQVGFVRLPVRLTDEEEIQISFIVDEANRGD